MSDAGPTTPDALFDELRAHPDWPERRRDAVLDRLVERFPAADLIRAVRGRLHDLGGADAETLLRLVEAHPRPDLLDALALALAAQPGLAPERAWDALAVLDGAGVLDDHPALAERWEELNETLDDAGSIEELVGQIEDDPEGIWLALQGLVAVEPEVRPEIVAGLARVPLGPGLVEFLRLLAYCHDEPTRAAALAALAADPDPGPPLRDAWADLAAHHPVAVVAAAARQRFGADGPPAVVARPTPRLTRVLVTAVDGRGQGRVVLGGSRDGRRATAVFLCDVGLGLVDLVGEIEPESAGADATFDEIAGRLAADAVEGDPALALGLLGGGLFLSGPAAPPSWRFWVEATAGHVTPRAFRTEVPGIGDGPLGPAETAACSSAVLDACADWLDASPLTFELAEEILLREGQSPPDPKRDAGAYRFLFEHRLQGQLETYRRMLLWMAGFWRSSGADGLTRAALEIAAQLSDAPNVVPGHPFAVALTTRSLAAAQDGLRRGIDPRREPRP